MKNAFTGSCGLAAIAFLVHAAFAPFYEKGIAAYLAPLFFVLVAFTFGALLQRRRWSWRLASGWCLAWILLSLVFPPMPVHFGGATAFARILVSVEVFACFAVFWLMRSPSIKSWFHGASEA